MDIGKFRMKWKKVFLAAMISLCCSLHLSAQKGIRFEHISIKDGLTQNSILCILQDEKGFLWFGTEDGLNRYDGYDFKIFKHKFNDNTTLSNNNIKTLLNGEKGYIWVGTETGLNRYDRKTNRFTHSFKIEGTANILQAANITSIIKDHKKQLWVGTEKHGLFMCRPDKEIFSRYSFSNKINCLAVDHNNRLWVGSDDGVFILEPGGKKCKPLSIDIMKKPNGCSKKVLTIYEDRFHTFWIGTYNSLIRSNSAGKQFRTVHYENQVKKCEDASQIRVIFEDEKSNLWIGTYGQGLYQKVTGQDDFINFSERPLVPASLSNNKVYSIYQDKGGIIWVGTEAGANKIDFKKNQFSHFTEEPDNPKSLKGSYVWSFLKDKLGTLWVGTDRGLNKYDAKTGTFSCYKPEPNQSDTADENRVLAIYEDHSLDLWIGTQGSGLKKFDKIRGTFIQKPVYKNDERNPNSLGHNRVTSILEDKNNNLWIGTQGGGLNRLNPNRDGFYRFKNIQGVSGSLSHDHVTCLLFDRKGTLWIGTEEGLNRLNNNEETFTVYSHNAHQKNSLSYNYIYSLIEDRRGFIWIGTYSGLNCLDPGSGIIKNYRETEGGLPSDTIDGIAEDKKGCLWISTAKGLFKFNPGTGEQKNYDDSDGLQSNEFNGGAYYKTVEGEMFFGGINGYNQFFPQNIQKNNHIPPIVLTGFRKFNAPDYLFNPVISEINEIKLSYRDSIISFEFAALDFSIPSKNKYRYRMEGVDPDWVRSDSKVRFATYTNLSPGKNVFRVQGSNNDGEWNFKGVSIIIDIIPPIWKTWWFIGLIGILLLVLLFIGYRMRTKFLREKLAEQQEVQEILRHSRDEMEKARDLAEIRNAENEKLLTAISFIFIAVDSDGLIFQWNKPAEKFFGLKRDTVIKKPFTAVLCDYIDEEKLDEIVQKGLNPGTPVKEIEIGVDFKFKGAGIKLLLSSISHITDRAGKKLGFLLLAEDITNRKEEEMLRNLSKKLESLGQMASGIAHEIKTPLQYIGHNARFVIDSFKEVVKLYEILLENLPEIENSDKKEISEKIKQIIAQYDMEYIMQEIPIAADQMINGVNRVSDIVNSMNEFSHPGRGFKEKSDINRLLKNTLVMIQNKIKKSADIELELFKHLPLISCYPAELNQVFLNILVNAWDAVVETGKWGTIKITTALEGQEAVIAISDSGCGIPDEIKDNIFNPFFTTKEVGRGTGQGLSLSHNIIEKHKGKLDFTSEVGKGTSFHIRLPIEGEH